jgi:hypothetical protein
LKPQRQDGIYFGHCLYSSVHYAVIPKILRHNRIKMIVPSDRLPHYRNPKRYIPM